MQPRNLVPVIQFCTQHNIEVNFINELQEYELIEIVNEQEAIFVEEERLSQLEKLVRLHYELGVNLEGIDVINGLLQKLEAAQNEMKALRNQLRFYEL